MKKYYIFLKDEQQGPFTFDELKKLNLSNETLIWFEGQSDWRKLSEIEELKPFLKSIPPPINTQVQTPLPVPKRETTIVLEEDDDEESKIFGIKKNLFYTLVAAVVVLIMYFAFNTYQQNSRERLDLINSATQTHNEQLEQQQKEIAEQQARIEEQEHIEAERIAREKKQAIDNRIVEIKKLAANNYQALEEAKRKLNNVTGFKLLRTASERNAQIQAVQSEVDYYKEEIRKLEEEFNNLNNEK